MNAADVLKYGHQTVLQTLDGVPMAEWETTGVCGVWSVKEIVVHLASFEQLLAEVLTTQLDGGPTPTLDELLAVGDEGFNDLQVPRRRGKPADEALAEYSDWHARVMPLLARLPGERLRQPGTIPWYGDEYSLEDLLVYQYYGHKREHCAQVDLFRDRLAGAGVG